MVKRIAGVMALIAFAVCLVAGGIEAGNPFSTTVLRALAAMGGTLVIGLLVGAMAKAMIEENLKLEQEKLKKSSPPAGGNDR